MKRGGKAHFDEPVLQKGHSLNTQPYFVENAGQVTTPDGRPAEDVAYKVTKGGVTLYFQKDRVSYVYPKKEYQAAPNKPMKDSVLKTTGLYRMDMVLKGANPKVELIGKKLRQGFSRHFTQTGEQLKAHHYGKILYEEIYQNVDLVYKFQNGKLKYEFIVEKGGNIEDIQMKYKGVKQLHQKANGGITLEHAYGNLQEGDPITYQSLEREQKLTSAFNVEGDKTIGFNVEEQARKPYVIDPFLKYSTYLGGSNNDKITTIAVNEAGGNQIVVGGKTKSTDFPNNIGPNNLQGGMDAFLAKYSSGGTLLKATYFGTPKDLDIVTDISIVNKSSGFKVYAIGTSSGSVFNGTSPTKQFKGKSGNLSPKLVFIAKFNGDLTLDRYSLVGSDSRASDLGGGIVAEGNTLYTVMTHNPILPSDEDFPQTNASNYDGATEGVAAGFSTDLTTHKFSHYIGGNKQDYLTDVKKLPNKLPVLKGVTNSDFGLIAGTPYQSTYGGGSSDYFVGTFDGQNGAPAELSYLGGSSKEGNLNNNYNEGLDLTEDSNGNFYIHVTGFTESSNYPVSQDAVESQYGAQREIIYTRLEGQVNQTLDYSTFITGDKRDEGKAVIGYGGNEALISGITNSTDIDKNYRNAYFPGDGQATIGTGNFRKSGGIDNYIIRLKQDQQGNQILWSSFFGGSSDDFGLDLVNFPGNKQDYYLAGYTISQDYPATNNSAQTQNQGGEEGFLTGFTQNQTCKLAAHTDKQNFTPNDQATIMGSYKINNSLTIKQGRKVFLKEADIVFDQCASLVVEADAHLIIEESLLRSCNKFWKGIIVNQSGRIEVTNSRIQDAQVGIEATTPKLFTIKESKFEDNIHHILLTKLDQAPKDSSGLPYPIVDNIFGDLSCKQPSSLRCNRNLPNWTGKCNMINAGVANSAPKLSNMPYIISNEFVGETNNLPSVQTSKGILLNKASGQKANGDIDIIKNNSFGGGLEKSGIRIENSGEIGLYYNDFTLSSSEKGISFVNARNIKIDSNSINSSGQQFYTVGIIGENQTNTGITTKNPELKDNSLTAAETAIKLKNVRGASIKSNILEDFNHGIEYYADQNYTNSSTIYKNKITGGTPSNKTGHGIVVAPIKDPVGASTGANNDQSTINLEIRCNKIWYNELGIVGSGYLIDQISNTQPAGNMFNDPANPQSSPSRNSEWDILWRNRFTSTDWTYHYSAQTIRPNELNSTTLDYSPKTINGKSIGNSTNPNPSPSQVNYNSISYLGCYGTWKRNPFSTGKQEVQNQPVQVYPNPVQDEVTIQTPDIGEGQIRVMNMTGQTVLTDRIQGSSQTLNTENWGTGTYLIRINSGQGKTFTKKLLKVSQ